MSFLFSSFNHGIPSRQGFPDGRNAVRNSLIVNGFLKDHVLSCKRAPFSRWKVPFCKAFCRQSHGAWPCSDGQVCTHCREIPINNMDIHLQKHDENVKFAPKTVTKHYYYEKV